MKKVTIYTTPSCPYCVRSKELLAAKGVRYNEVDVAVDAEKRAEMSQKYNWMTVPMIVIGDEFIGGYDDLAKLEAEGKLDEKLNA